MTPRSPAFLALASILTLGCPAEDEPPVDGGSTTAEGTTAVDESSSSGRSAETTSEAADTTSENPDELSCACLTQDGPFLQSGCDLDEPCEPILVQCDQPNPSDCGFEELEVVDPSLIDCHREALTAGRAAMLRWELPYIPDPGVAGQRALILLPGDGTAMTWHESWGNGSYVYSDVSVALVRSESELQACDALEPTERMLCLFQSGTEGLTTCNEAYDFPIG